MNLKIKKLHPDAIIPNYATNGAACFDLCTMHDVVINRFELVKVKTGLAFEIPHGHSMSVYIRSGHAFKNRLTLVNGVGVIDSDFRGEVVVGIVNTGDMPVNIKSGSRVAQAMIVPIKQVEFEVVEELTSTTRGTGGFGSTGK